MHHSRTIDDGIAQLAKELAAKESAPVEIETRDRVIASVGGDD
jgi:hypothetical protein